MTVTVTNLEGRTLPGVWVKASGPVDREASTDESGMVVFRNMGAGTYRLRFEHDEFVTFEREVVMAARALPVTVALNAAPPKPPPPPVTPPTPPPPALPPSGPPTFVSIPDFVERNFVGNAPSLTSLVGCAPSASSNLLQLRDPLAPHSHADSDEMLYVVAGEGTHKISGRDVPLSAGVFAVVPRGTPHSIVRRGSRPIIVLSILSGEPCVPK
jgi:mannose-6-phosphate isomerase-like protein (cupin superfamily)